MDWYRLFVRMVACSIVVHDALYVCRDGKAYLTNCILPTFGLHLNAAGKLAVHAGLLASCLLMLSSPTTVAAYPLCLLFLSLKIASYSLRLANHMIFAWFLLLLLCIAAARGGQAVGSAQVELVILGTQGLTLILYFFAFFHKLNREYFVMKNSCATLFVDFFCLDRGIRRPGLLRFYRYFGVYGTVLIEAAIPLLLCFERTRCWALLLGIAFHFILALMGIVNFSMFMFTGLLAFLTPGELHAALIPPVGAALAGLACAIAAFLGVVWRWTPRKAAEHCDYVYRNPAWLIQSAFAVLSGAFLYACLLALPQVAAAATTPPPWPTWGQFGSEEQIILTLFFGAFVANGLGPYLGYKTEFSFAMFSNLRLEPWGHLLIPASWRLFRHSQYVEVRRIDGLPSLAQVKGNRAAELAVFVLSKPSDYYYSRYFFREALNILATRVTPPAEVFVAYVERGTYRESSGTEVVRRGFCLPINRYPFVMPRDPDARHSEQGSLVPVHADKQLF